MNNNEKIAEIKNIITSHDEKRCPYCFKPLEEFVNKEGKTQQGCYNHHQGDLIIDTEDYYFAIETLVKYGESKKFIMIRKITDF